MSKYALFENDVVVSWTVTEQEGYISVDNEVDIGWYRSGEAILPPTPITQSLTDQIIIHSIYRIRKGGIYKGIRLSVATQTLAEIAFLKEQYALSRITGAAYFSQNFKNYTFENETELDLLWTAICEYHANVTMMAEVQITLQNEDFLDANWPNPWEIT